MLELNKEYTYSQICEILGWEQKAGNSKKAQLKEIEFAYEFYHPMNKKTHKPKKSYIFTRKICDLVEPSKSNCGGAHNTKNIQSMIDYLQAKFNLDSEWYSFTDWYCEKLELLHKGICNAVYHPDEIDTVCEECDISDGKLFAEYVSAAKSELKNMFLKSLSYLKKKNKITYHDEYKFIYQLGERTKGYVITGCLNEVIKDIETTVCNDLNEEYKMSKKMKGRQLLKIIYSKEKFTNEFKEFCLLALNDNDEALRELNRKLSYQHPTFHPEYSSICSERQLISYYRGISITDMELEESNNVESLAVEITNRIRTKVRCSLRKSYRKNIKQSDIKAIEKVLFQYCDDNFDDGYMINLSDADIAELDEIFNSVSQKFSKADDNWVEPNDFNIEEVNDMAAIGKVQMNLTLANTGCVGHNDLCKVVFTPISVQSKTDDCNEPDYIETDNESHSGEIFCGLFFVTGKNSDYIDIDDLY